jgi:hypothetical protein
VASAWPQLFTNSPKLLDTNIDEGTVYTGESLLRRLAASLSSVNVIVIKTQELYTQIKKRTINILIL